MLWCLSLLSILIPYVSSVIEPCFVDQKLLFKKDEMAEKSVSKNISLLKTMYQESKISFTIDCESEDETAEFELDIFYVTYNCQILDLQNIPPTFQFSNLACKKHIQLNNTSLKSLEPTKLESMRKTNTVVSPEQNKTAPKENSKPAPDSASPNENASGGGGTRKRRAEDAVQDNTPPKVDENKNKKIKKTKKAKKVKVGDNVLKKTSSKGMYKVILKFTTESEKDMTIGVHLESKHRGSYLSAMNWPLLPFFGAMSLLYLAYAIGWLLASCCNWRDLLRLQKKGTSQDVDVENQFWIGGVIALGMFENALFYAEYSSISHHGKENGLLYFAEIVSCLKKALARILVVIVSMGFGIVKPRLGETLHKVLAVGGLYFLLASIEGCIRVKDDEKMILNSKTHMYALVPLIVLDIALCWWVFTSLVQTTRTLRIRKNVVKLTLYRHFTNTLVFAVIASLAYMVWMIKEAKFTPCVDATGLWLNEAIWPFLFAVILAVIMVLWRPSNNNQRYAFTPLELGDSDDDEDDDMTLSEAFDGMKMRNKSESSTVAKNRNKAEDDLKWVEENIPSVPSTLLPTLDSDEEIIMTKFETSKMD